MLPGKPVPGRLMFRRGEVVRGESYQIGGRRLTPIARVRAWGAAGGRFEIRSVEPVGLIEEVGGTRRLIAIGRSWGSRIGIAALVSVPVVAYLAASVLARAVRRKRPARKRRWGTVR